MAKLWTARDCNEETLRKGDLVQAAPGIGEDWWVSGMTLGVVVNMASDGYCNVNIKETASKNPKALGVHVAPGRCLAKIHDNVEVQPSERLLKLNMSFMY